VKVVIPAAGLGTRFLPATKSMPKEMLPVVNQPVIQYVVEEAVMSGANDIIIVTGRGKRAVEDHFDHNPDLGASNELPSLQHLDALTRTATIHFVRQRAMLGLANAIACAERHVGDEPFGVLLGDSIHECDTPILSQLRAVSDRHGGRATVVALERVPEARVSSYGIVGGKEVAPGVYRLDRMVEKPTVADAPSSLALTGAYYLSSSIFAAIHATPPGRKGEVELTDALDRLSRTEEVYGLEFQGRRYDTGTPLLWLETNLRFALRRPDMREMVSRVLRDLGGDSGDAAKDSPRTA
jgi:UTP--glucose-1-phosphate uridylyltransferase